MGIDFLPVSARKKWKFLQFCDITSSFIILQKGGAHGGLRLILLCLELGVIWLIYFGLGVLTTFEIPLWAGAMLVVLVDRATSFITKILTDRRRELNDELGIVVCTRYLALKGVTMSFNTYGHLFRVTTWGESHGPALGATVDGCPPGIQLLANDIQLWLDKRKPGQSKFTTQRREADEVEILSGVFEDVTTGTPIQLMIRNTDQRSKDYGDIAEKFRPGHADITYWQKYGIRDYRGGGRSSARETAARVAAGGVARAALTRLIPGLKITGYMVGMGELEIDRSRFDWDEIGNNPFWTPDAQAAGEWEGYLDGLRKSGSSAGAVIEVAIQGCPPGLGAPVYGKIDTDLAAAMMSINAVKGVEIGEGMAAGRLTGEANADEISMGPSGPVFGSNHAGGILGGITTGQDIVVRFAVKPTSSILTPRKTITKTGEETEIVTKGRHDPCVGIRAVPVAEAMAAAVVLDHFLLDRAQTGGERGPIG